MKKACIIVGTRPELIKLAPVYMAFRASPEIDVSLCSTGQHREMLDAVSDAFGLVPDDDLRLMNVNQTLAGLTARMIEALDAYYLKEKPDIVLVQGDTTTAFCGALCAQYRHIPVGHVEAGLRTYDLDAPWPEEAFRQMVSRIASLNFAPTRRAQENLLQEKIAPGKVFITGNTVVDALLWMKKRVTQQKPIIPGLPENWGQDWGKRKLVLITGHRRENFGDKFLSICNAIVECAERFPEVAFVYPVHLNPNVQEPVRRIIQPASEKNKNIFLIEPLAYAPFVSLMDRASLILTDSGGIQEEAPSLNKPVLIMRDKTERPEATEAGTAKIVGEDKDSIVENVARLLTDECGYASMASVANPFGDGYASERILKACLGFLRGDSAPLPLEEAFSGT